MKRRNQLILLATVIAIAVAIHFASQRVAGRLFYSGPEFNVLLADGRVLDAQDIQDIVKRHAAEQKANFDFRQTSAFIMLTPLHTNVLATVHFGSGYGQPCFDAEIGRDGKVLRHRQGIATCGLGSLTSNSKPQTPF